MYTNARMLRTQFTCVQHRVHTHAQYTVQNQKHLTSYCLVPHQLSLLTSFHVGMSLESVQEVNVFFNND
uniref:Uncharacterized protein n=1 Tax=Anguilla anguilla TaxID=7936 RepID=A0A0E9WDW8_ANGAN